MPIVLHNQVGLSPGIRKLKKINNPRQQQAVLRVHRAPTSPCLPSSPRWFPRRVWTPTPLEESLVASLAPTSNSRAWKVDHRAGAESNRVSIYKMWMVQTRAELKTPPMQINSNHKRTTPRVFINLSKMLSLQQRQQQSLRNSKWPRLHHPTLRISDSSLLPAQSHIHHQAPINWSHRETRLMAGSNLMEPLDPVISPSRW